MIMIREEMKFQDTELMEVLKRRFNLHNLPTTTFNIDLLLRMNLFLNKVCTPVEFQKYPKPTGLYLGTKVDINYIKYVEVGGKEYSPYTKDLEVKELDYIKTGVNGYSFVLKDYCKEGTLFGVLYFDYLNIPYLRVGLIKYKDQIIKTAAYYSNMPGEIHGKLQWHLNWQPIKPDYWVWGVKESKDEQMTNLHHELKELWFDLRKDGIK